MPFTIGPPKGSSGQAEGERPWLSRGGACGNHVPSTRDAGVKAQFRGSGPVAASSGGPGDEALPGAESSLRRGEGLWTKYLILCDNYYIR